MSRHKKTDSPSHAPHTTPLAHAEHHGPARQKMHQNQVLCAECRIYMYLYEGTLAYRGA
jgi:hypothetical protein